MSLDNIKSILEKECVFLSDKIYNSLENELNVRTIKKSKSNKKSKSSNHICFLIDKNNELLTYGFNIFFKTSSFPFSLHSEINAINKYYKKTLTKPMLKSKKKLIIIKVSKIGIIGNSKPCLSCANFIYNNMDILNITDILY